MIHFIDKNLCNIVLPLVFYCFSFTLLLVTHIINVLQIPSEFPVLRHSCQPSLSLSPCLTSHNTPLRAGRLLPDKHLTTWNNSQHFSFHCPPCSPRNQLALPPPSGVSPAMTVSLINTLHCKASNSCINCITCSEYLLKHNWCDSICTRVHYFCISYPSVSLHYHLKLFWLIHLSSLHHLHIAILFLFTFFPFFLLYTSTFTISRNFPHQLHQR